MAHQFLVCSVPSDNDTRSNHVFMNPSDHRMYVGGSEAIVIGGFPLTARPHDKIQPGNIAMNSIQRRMLGISVATGATVSFTVMERNQPALAEMRLRVDHIMASKRGGTLDCKEFNAFCKAMFMGQAFREGQMIAIVMDSGMRLLVVVERVKLAGPGSPLAVGYLEMPTAVIVAAGDKSEIALTNVSDTQMDAQQTQLVANFNLESMGIGGLRTEFGEVFRRAFASRILPPSYVKKLGIKHVKGVLLFGPPGTGKTLIARKIGEILNCHEPKIVNGPEVFDKFVGGTEANIRKLFADAEAEQAAKGEQSQLHLIIFDEFDAICKQRGAVRDSTGVADNVVNQLLSKIDGVSSLNNVLLIGMTNRKDLIDEAILRPGRFEVHVEIGLPDEPGRVEIFRIHTRGMRENGMMGEDVSIDELASLTGNYSGAEIEGVVRAATSFSINRHIDMDHPENLVDPSTVFVTRADFIAGVAEVTPAFGQAKEECKNMQRGGIIPYGHQWDTVESSCRSYVADLKDPNKVISSLSVLVEGPPGCGKSAVAAFIAELAQFPYIKVVSPDDMVGYGEMQRVNIIRKAFEDAYKSSQSCIILDDLERLIDFSQLGGRYSNTLLQALLVLTKRPAPEGKKLLVIATTAEYDIMDSLGLAACFAMHLQVPLVSADGLPVLVADLGIRFATVQDQQSCVQMFPRPLPIKKLLLILEMAAEPGPTGTQKQITFSSLSKYLESACVR